MEHVLHMFGIGGTCGEHMILPWIASSGAFVVAFVASFWSSDSNEQPD